MTVLICFAVRERHRYPDTEVGGFVALHLGFVCGHFPPGALMVDSQC